MARVVGYATSGLAPRFVLMTPVESIRQLLSRVGWTLDDVDLFEINEAFAAQMVAVLRELALPPGKVNVSGGAIALGHPIGASGARILTTLLYAMAARDARRGVAALCLGGGNGVALAVERRRREERYAAEALPCLRRFTPVRFLHTWQNEAKVSWSVKY